MNGRIHYKDLAWATLLDLYLDTVDGWLTFEEDRIVIHSLGNPDTYVFDKNDLVKFINYELRASFDNAYGTNLLDNASDDFEMEVD